METMGQRIKRLRTENNLTQEELGNKVGLKRAAINKYEKGNVENMKRSIVEKMSDIFSVSPSYLMALDDEKKTSPIETIYNKLNEPAKKEVYSFAEKKLEEQNKVIELPHVTDTGTLAAHSADPDKTFDEDEIDKINAYLDELDEEYDSKHKK